MKQLLLAVLGIFIFAGGAVSQSIDLHDRYTPTKSEWLDIQLTHAYDMVALGEKGVGSIDYMIGDRYIDVYVNCEKRLKNDLKKMLEVKLNAVSKKVFLKYDWSRHILLRVEFLSNEKRKAKKTK